MSIICTDVRTLNAYGFDAQWAGYLYLRPRTRGSTKIRGRDLTESIGLHSQRVRALIKRLREGDSVDDAIAHAESVAIPEQRFA